MTITVHLPDGFSMIPELLDAAPSPAGHIEMPDDRTVIGDSYALRTLVTVMETTIVDPDDLADVKVCSAAIRAALWSPAGPGVMPRIDRVAAAIDAGTPPP